jgi:hypothetical protein
MLLLLKQVLLPLLFVFSLRSPAPAQTAPPAVLSGTAGQRAITGLLFGKPAGRASQPAASATLPFRRDAAITRQAEALTVRQVKLTNATAGEQLGQLFASKDVLAAWGEAMQAYGLTLTNVADALTANWLVLYLCANEITAPPAAAQVAGLRRQLRRVCALPSLANRLKTSTQRQQLADYLHLQSLLLNQAQSGAETAQDTAASATLARRARQVARQNMGFDPTTVRLTTNGLVRK